MDIDQVRMYWLPPCTQIGSDLLSMGIPVTADHHQQVDDKYLQTGYLLNTGDLSGYQNISLDIQIFIWI